MTHICDVIAEFEKTRQRYDKSRACIDRRLNHPADAVADLRNGIAIRELDKIARVKDVDRHPSWEIFQPLLDFLFPLAFVVPPKMSFVDAASDEITKSPLLRKLHIA